MGKSMGIFHKFNVTRVDGTDAPGGKHDGCDYFVLDVTHDPLAIPALQAYAVAAYDAGYETLAVDLQEKVEAAKKRAEMEGGT